MFEEAAARIAFKTADVAGLRLFYREAGDPSKPTIVLLHGFPSSSYQFHDLIPRLADRFHVIAPDYPGMGFSDAPAPTVLRPTFDDVTMAIDAFIAQRAPGPVILYMHDIGGPIGMRIATAHPERIAGLIFQNTVISLEGWNPARLKVYERLGGPETPDKLAEVEQFATVGRDKILHQTGARRHDALNPAGDRHLQPRSFSQMSMVPNPKRRTEVIVQPRRRIMRARIGKAGFLTGTALPCGVAQQEARRRCLRASIESVGGLLNVTPQTNRWFCSSQT